MCTLKTKTNHILFLLFIIALVPRVILVNDGLFHHDSVQLAKALENNDMTGAVGGRPGMMLIYSLPYLIYPDAYIVATYMTILFACLSVCMVFLLVKQLFDNTHIALTTAGLFSFCPLFLSITTYAKSHAIGLFFILVALWFFVKSLKYDCYVWAFLAGFSFIYSLFVRIDNVLYIPLFIFLYFYSDYIFKTKAKRYDLKYLYCLFLPIILGLSIGLARGWLFKYGKDSLVLNFNKWLYLYTAGSLSLVDSIGLLTFIILVLSLFLLLKRKQDWLLIFCGLWFGTIFFPMVSLNVASARFFIGALIPLFIFISFYLRSIKKGWICNIIFISLVVFMYLSIMPILIVRNQYSSGKVMGELLGDIVGDGEYVLLGDNSVFAEYYGGVSVLSPNANISGKSVYVMQHVIDLYDLNYTVIPVTSFDWEDYHHAELKLKFRYETIYKVIQ